MYDIRPLEEEWKRYRKKKMRPWYIGSMFFVFLLFAILVFSNNSEMSFNALSAYFNTLKSKVVPEEVKIEKVKHVKSNIVVNAPLMTIEVEKKAVAVDEIVEDSPANILVDIPILDGKQEDRSRRSGNSRKKIHLDIIKTTNVSAYKDVERRFKNSHDTDDSLFLARSYYKKGKYKKSEYWALQTNKVSPNIEESMIIFVKSKMKLGRRDEARNILTAYLKKSNSNEARKLLYSIENGKF